ncbi:MAG: hypothetical protein FWG88_02555 [Oscillospiraceae bacterium]|nr:hypothetical protein [Oscillospiraceae bacterium]
MIDDLNKLIKQEARNSIKSYLLLLIVSLIVIAVTFWQAAMGQPILVTHPVIAILPLSLFYLPYMFIGNIIHILRPNAKKDIDKYCRKTKNPVETFAELEKTWKDGTKVELKIPVIQTPLTKGGEVTQLLPICIDNEYLIMLAGIKVRIIPLKNAVWVYSDKQNKLEIFYAQGDKYEQKKFTLKTSYNTSIVVDIINHYCPDIFAGQNNTAKNLWNNKDIAGLRELARKKGADLPRKPFQLRQTVPVGAKTIPKSNKGLKYGFIQFALLIPAITIIGIPIFSPMRFFKSTATALEVLESYSSWMNFVVIASLAAGLFILAANIYIFVLLLRSGDFMRFNIVIGIISIGAVILVSIAMTSPLDRFAVREDISAIENSELVSELVFIRLGSLRDDIGGIIPYNSYGEKVVYRFDMRKADNGLQLWVNLPFDLSPSNLRSLTESETYRIEADMIPSDYHKLFSDDDRRYLSITYTPNFKLVVEARPTNVIG